MQTTEIQRYRLAAFQTRLLRRLSGTSALLGSSVSGRIGPQDVESEAQEAVARFVHRIAPIVGPDVVRGFRRPEDFPKRGPLLFPIFSLGDVSSYTTTDFLVTFDDFGLLSAGITSQHYPADGIDATMDKLSREIPLLASYFLAVQQLVSEPSVKSAYDAISSNSSWNGDKYQFERRQTLWFGLQDRPFLECVRLLLFVDEREWDYNIVRLTQVSERVVLNPSLYLAPDEADQIIWALSGAARLLHDYGSGSDIDWSTTSRTIHSNSPGADNSRVGTLTGIRESLRNAAAEMTPDQNYSALPRILRDIQLGTTDFLTDGPDGWLS